MTVPWILCVVIGLCAIVKCQQPHPQWEQQPPQTADDNSELSAELVQKCQPLIQNLQEENDRLKGEIELLKSKMEALHEVDEDESEGSNESHSRSRGLRSKRGATCDSGTLAAWACAPQCVFKLKGLCGLSLKNLCHC